ncbi:MAG TPA: hypothetical protein VMY37_17245 [Thermoguttaceae bacterium]|nr:hypothetical protein [Thermoguttaceae bacterium]
MKPQDRMKAIGKVAFRPDEQPGLFGRGGPVVVLLSDVKHHVEALVADIIQAELDLRNVRREMTTIKKGGKTTARGRGNKHLFPEQLEIAEDARLRRVCATYGADFKAVCQAAKLYSESNAVKYNSWPAAIEVALANDYQWLRVARRSTVQAATVGDHKPTPRQLEARAKLAAARAAREES